ncbi:MAG: beta-lactamase family protein [Croceitalea sp.]|nr:beta-lactamase family protein [Croceitalea sp.]
MLFGENPSLQPLEGLKGIEFANAQLKNLAIEKKVPGMSVTILKNGKKLLQAGYGFADLEQKVKVDPKKSLFRIASISKCITGLAFGKMVEEGLLHWDDSFYKYVVDYPQKKYDFTLRQLASHTAGIRAYKGKEFALNQPFTITDSLEVFKNDPLVFEPGRGYLYNSFDFVLLSLAMQKASDVPFEKYVNEKVLLPLGMSKTVPRMEKDHDVANFYTTAKLGFKPALEVDNFYKLAGGGYLSTSDDIARLGQAVLERKLLKEATYKELLMAQTVNGKSTYYGLGFQVTQGVHGRSYVGHVGNSVGAYTNLFVYPEEELVFVVLVNSSDPKIQAELKLLLEQVLL